MNFFDYIKNESFFKPLILKYHRIYYDCILILIDKSKELPVLYENDGRNCITAYLKELNIQLDINNVTCDEAVAGSTAAVVGSTAAVAGSTAAVVGNTAAGTGSTAEDAGITDAETGESGTVSMADIESSADDTVYNSASALQDSSVLALFYDCGWLLPREIGRNGEYVINISPDCRRFIDFLQKLTEKSGEGAMSNRIFAMYEIMQSAFDENSGRMDRPYMNILVPLIDNESELKNELLDLKESISEIMKVVIAFQDVNEFGQYILKDEMLDHFFNEYFFVKNNGMIPTQLSLIRNKLRVLRNEEMIDKMSSECAEKLLKSKEDARERVEHYFAELQYFLEIEYEENMELIDKRINGYYNLANTRIMLMASSGIRLESVMNDFLNTIAGFDEDKQNVVMDKVASCIRISSQKYVGYRSFAKQRRVKNEGENIGLADRELSDDEKAMRTDKLINESVNHYSVTNVDSFLKLRMGNNNELSIKEQPVKYREEALMYAAAMLYASNDEFQYDITLSDNIVCSEIADISDARISVKGADRSDRRENLPSDKNFGSANNLKSLSANEKQ